MMKPSLEREFFSMFISFSLLCCAEDYKPVLTDESSFGKHPNLHLSLSHLHSPSPPHRILNSGQLAAHPTPEIAKPGSALTLVWQAIKYQAHTSPHFSMGRGHASTTC